MIWRRFGKRPFDIVASGAALIALSPVIATIALLVRLRLGRPIIFRQQRPGLNGRIFLMSKFRTMSDALDSDGQPLPDHERLSSFGRWLRTTSLDELPELWNILRGDMSIIGPRPLLVEYLPLYSPEQARRHEVRPGLTGWAQVNGRNAISWEEKFALDVWYVDRVSFWLDMKVLFYTVLIIVRRDGISAEGEATAGKFNGSRSCHEDKIS